MEGAHELESACSPILKGKEPTYARLKDTFLTALYVITDDFCHSHQPKKRPGPTASLSESEVLTLAIFARFCRFASERDFYRYAKSNLRDAFPTLPDRSQFNRCVRSQARLIEEVALHLARMMEAQRSPYGARIVCPPKRNGRKRRWPKHLRRWAASIRQIIESVYDKLHGTFGLRRERPHDMSGLRARLAARVALHNFCIWLNEQLGSPRLAFADLLGW